MPRKARIDAPGALQHIIIRGLERKAIFKDDSDRENFLDRLSGLVSESKTGYLELHWGLHDGHMEILLPRELQRAGDRIWWEVVCSDQLAAGLN